VKKGDLRLEKIDLGQILEKVADNYHAFNGRGVTVNLESQKDVMSTRTVWYTTCSRTW